MRGALLGLLAFAVFAGAIPSGFAFDDRGAIETNPVVTGEFPVREVWTRDFWGTQPPMMGMFRPLVTLWFRLDWWLSGGRPTWFHATNVLLHVLVVMLAYGVGRRLVGERAAWVGAAVFACLAAPAEAVQGLVGRADLLLAACALVGLAAHRSGRRGAAVVTWLAFAFALGCKESSIVLPAVWLLLDWWRPAARSWRTQLLRLLPCAPILLVAALLRSHAVGAMFRPKADPVLSPLGVADAGGRLFGAGRIFLTHYLRGLVDPFSRRYLCTVPACSPSTPSDGIAWLGILFFAGLFVLTVVLARRSSLAALGLGWCLLFFLPVSNFLVGSTTSYAERLLYAPAIGLGWALGVAVERIQAPRWRIAILVLFLGANVLAVQLRHLDWRSNDALFLSGLDAEPDDTVVQTNAAHVLFQRHEMMRAVEHAQRALELWPANISAASLLGGSLDALDQIKEAEAAFQRALTGPGRDDARLMTEYARFLAHRGRLPEAQVWIQRALQRQPGGETRELADRITAALGEK